MLVEVSAEAIQRDGRPLPVPGTNAVGRLGEAVNAFVLAMVQLPGKGIRDLQPFLVREHGAFFDQVPEQDRHVSVVVIEPGQRIMLVLDPLAVDLLDVLDRLLVRKRQTDDLAGAELVTRHVVHGHAFADTAPAEVANGAIAERSFPGFELLDVRRRFQPLAELRVHRPTDRQVALHGGRLGQDAGQRLDALVDPNRVASPDDHDAVPVAERIVHRPDDVAFRPGVFEIHQAVMPVVQGTDRLVGRAIAQHDEIALEGHGCFWGVLGDDRHLDAAAVLDLPLDGRGGVLIGRGRRRHDGRVRLAVFHQADFEARVLNLIVLGRDGRRRGRRRRRDASHDSNAGHQHAWRRIPVRVQVDYALLGIRRCRALDGHLGELGGRIGCQAGLDIFLGRQKSELQVSARGRCTFHRADLGRDLIGLAAFQLESLEHANLDRGVAVCDQQRLPAVGNVHDVQFLFFSAAPVLGPSQGDAVAVHALGERRVLQRHVERFLAAGARHGQQGEHRRRQRPVPFRQCLAHVCLLGCIRHACAAKTRQRR